MKIKEYLEYNSKQDKIIGIDERKSGKYTAYFNGEGKMVKWSFFISILLNYFMFQM